jgi:hypothetical protein
VNEALYRPPFDPNARVGERGEILIKEMKFLSIDNSRLTPKEIYRKTSVRGRKQRQERNKSVNATLVPILPAPRLPTPQPDSQR